MDPLFTVILAVLAALAVTGLVVGVSNDASNFLNSAIGSKAAPRYIIMAVASVGIILGSLFSSGMMEVARSGMFYPQMFTFHDVMLLFLTVMLTNVILLDLFNTMGLPTSTTVSLVFELLGSAVAVACMKIWSQEEGASQLPYYINATNALGIISGILLSVVVAFVCGSIVMYVTRVIFSFRYRRTFRYFGSVWCGLALTAISYFALFKGVKGTTIISPETMRMLEDNLWTVVGVMIVGWTLIMAVVQNIFKVNILKITVLAGTFSLALAFAGNDLVNFIGVFIQYGPAKRRHEHDDGRACRSCTHQYGYTVHRRRYNDAYVVVLQKSATRHRHRGQSRSSGVGGGGTFRFYFHIAQHSQVGR